MLPIKRIKKKMEKRKYKLAGSKKRRPTNAKGKYIDTGVVKDGKYVGGRNTVAEMKRRARLKHRHEKATGKGNAVSRTLSHTGASIAADTEGLKRSVKRGYNVLKSALKNKKKRKK